MRFFLYEYITAGGTFLDGSDPPAGSLLREGHAMVEAVAADFQAIKSAHVQLMHDVRVRRLTSTSSLQRMTVDSAASHARHFDQCAAEADATLVIAPECNGRLRQLTRRAEQLGARLFCPDSAFVALTSDKVKTTAQLADSGVPVPSTRRCRLARDVSDMGAGPFVAKPIDGAGSLNVTLCDRNALTSRLDGERELCVQEYCDGQPASVSALCGAERPLLLPPCWQRLEPPEFAYQGGERIMSAEHIERAHRLASRALAALPATRGYVGVDLVLGDRATGGRDVIIEINPRITTSYVGLRRLAEQNLGWQMWQQSRGVRPHLTFSPRPLQFRPSDRTQPHSP